MFQEFGAWIRGTRRIRKNLRGYAPTPDMMRQLEMAAMARQELADTLEAQAMNRKHNEVISGNFIYYRVIVGTNIRKSYDCEPIIFGSRYSAECARDGDNPESVISVAAYNRIFEEIEDGE